MRILETHEANFLCLGFPELPEEYGRLHSGLQVRKYTIACIYIEIEPHIYDKVHVGLASVHGISMVTTLEGMFVYDPCACYRERS